MFIKYLYYDQDAFPKIMAGSEQGGAKLTLDESLYLFECNDFYGLSNDRLKQLSEKRLSNSLDRFNVL
jgi:hypothetical protein